MKLLYGLVAVIAATLVSGQVPCDPSVTCPTFNCHPNPSCPAKDPVHPVQLPHTDCSKFYKCSGGNACEQICPTGLHYNKAEQADNACDWPERACCDPTVPCDPCIPGVTCPTLPGPGDVPTTPIPIPTTPVPVPTTPAPIPTTPAPIPTLPDVPCDPSVTCPLNCVSDMRCPPRDGPTAILLPSTNCNKFYKCQSGRACEFDCPPGLHFNKDRMVCDWPHQSAWSCNLCLPGACVNDARCPLLDNPLAPTFLPHAQDCSRFYICSHGQACEHTCPAGLHWSPAHSRCEWPNVACCDPTIECRPGCPEVCPPPATTTTTTTTTTLPPPVTTTVLPDVPCEPCLQQCIDDSRCPIDDNPFDPTLLPHENDCTRFYKCAFGKRCLMVCQPGEHFSEEKGRCELPQYACCDRTIICLPFPTPGDPCWPDACPTPAPANCRPDAGCPLDDDPNNPLLLPVPANCGSFYKCNEGQACLLPCPPGQHFSQQLQRCERPEIACCDQSAVCCAACVAQRRQQLNRLLGIKSYD
ncbi:probable chitinase 10 [Anopheles aquasalis]|uniref:probable chitinase 10 n=1 Tax=Anopheles aquasalis TaxID=42839 RepID=UPI00215B1D93|nr:probable chitinase 10 [Anopheles aquasalis]